MNDQPDLDLAAAHRIFSVSCFNGAWDLIDKPARTPDEDDEMLHVAHASLWHWLQRPDCTAENRCIGYWQLSRVYALTGSAARSEAYATRCLAASQGQSAFLRAYAFEALGRAAALAGRSDAAASHVKEARALLGQVTDPQERDLVEKDIDSIAV
jgi:hypothetical protein